MAQYYLADGVNGTDATTPNIAAYQPVSTMRIDARVAPDDYSASADHQTILSQWGATTERDFSLRINTTGKLNLDYEAAATATATNAVTITDGTIGWVRLDVTFHASAGVVTYSEADDQTTEAVGDVTFSQISTHTGLTLPVGSHDYTSLKVISKAAGSADDKFVGKLYQAIYTVDGSAVAHFNADDFNVGDSATATGTDVHTRVWTLAGAGASIQADPSAGNNQNSLATVGMLLRSGA